MTGRITATFVTVNNLPLYLGSTSTPERLVAGISTVSYFSQHPFSFLVYFMNLNKSYMPDTEETKGNDTDIKETKTTVTKTTSDDGKGAPDSKVTTTKTEESGGEDTDS